MYDLIFKVWNEYCTLHDTSKLVIRDKVYENRPSKICGKQPLKNMKRYGLLNPLSATDALI